MALVGLLQVSREAELIATPKPAPTTPEKAPQTQEPQEKTARTSNTTRPSKACTSPEQTHQRGHAKRERVKQQKETYQMSLHMERLAALRCRRRRLSRARRLAPAAVSRRPRCHQEMGRGRVRQGARPIRHRSWTKTPWHEGPRGQERWGTEDPEATAGG